MPGYLFFGVVVGVIVVAMRPFPGLAPICRRCPPTVVTMLAPLFVADAANEGILRIISPAFVALLPGVPMTIGAMELARSEVVAGASRLIYGVVQLTLLVFGVSHRIGDRGQARAAAAVGADGSMVVLRCDRGHRSRPVHRSIGAAGNRCCG